jgi:CDGSH-type Zn-finger protein
LERGERFLVRAVAARRFIGTGMTFFREPDCIGNLSSLPLRHSKFQIMNEPIIFQKGPIVQKVEPGTYWWCACGRSKSQPFCDGSHKGTGLGPLKTEITEAKTVAWCACKHSKTMPFCDGSHATLP